MILNLTPHPVRLYPRDTPDRINPADWQPVREIPVAQGLYPARIGEIPLGTQYYGDIPVEYVEYGSHSGTVHPMPPVMRGDRGEPVQFYIVSLPTALLLTYGYQNRPDLLVPYREVRNFDGTVIGCRQLGRPV